MKAFLTGLADLMEKHHISEFEVMEGDSGWSTTVEGISINTELSEYDEDGNVVRQYCDVEMPNMMNARDIRELLALVTN